MNLRRAPLAVLSAALLIAACSDDSNAPGASPDGAAGSPSTSAGAPSSSAGAPSTSAGSAGAPSTSGGSSSGEQQSALARVTTGPSAPGLAAAATGEIAFAFDLDTQTFKANANSVIAPFSITEALSMTYAGAVGDTHDAMAKVLHVTGTDSDYQAAIGNVDFTLGANANEKIEIASSLWGQTGDTFQGPFLDTLAINYGAGVHTLDFASAPDPSRLVINQWVSDHTDAAIPALLGPTDIDASTRFVLANAIHFVGSWQTPLFEPSNAPFHAASGDVATKFASGALTLPYAETDAFQAVELPYQSGTTSMVFIAPKAGGPSSIDAATYASLVAALAPTSLGLTMPLVNIDGGQVELRDALTQLGMGLAFTDGADFTAMIAKPYDLHAVVHHAIVTMDGSGTTATAATAVIGGNDAVATPGPSLHVTLDHPYFFALRDRTSGMILFTGHCETAPAGTN